MLDGEHDDTAHGDGMGDGDDPVFSRGSNSNFSSLLQAGLCL